MNTENKHLMFFSWVVLLSIYFLGWQIQTQLLLNHDVAWLLEAAKRLSNGGNYVTDFFENNPPLILYLYSPALLLTKITANLIFSFRIYIFFLTTLSLLYCYFFTKKIFTQNSIRLIFLSTLTLIFLVLPGPDFGQREHLMLILVMPYLLMMTVRIQGEAINHYLAASTGLLAGLGFAIKPYFLICFTLIELYYIANKKSIFTCIRIETAIILNLFIVYFISIFLLHPDYLFVIVPYALRWCYRSASAPWHFLIFFHATLFCYLPFIFYACKRFQNNKAISKILIIALIGFLASYFIQQTTFPYHLFPAYALAILTMTLFFSVLATQTTLTKRDYGLMLLFLTLMILLLLAKSEANHWVILIFYPTLFFSFFGFIFILLSLLDFENKPFFLGKVLLFSALILTLGYLSSLFIEVLPWYQHRFSLTVLILIFSYGLLFPGKTNEKIKQAFLCSFATLLFAFPIILFNTTYTRTVIYKQNMKKFIPIVQENAPHKSIYFLTTTMYQLATMQETNAVIASRFSAFWMLGGMIKAAYLTDKSLTSQQVQNDKEILINMVAEDLNKNKPDLVFVDASRRKNQLLLFGKSADEITPIAFDYLNDFLLNDQFQKAWLAYSYLRTFEFNSYPGGEIYTFKVFKRKA